MRYSTYILYSESLDKFYKGQTSNIIERLKRHNSGHELATKSGIPWKLLWKTEKDERSEAIKLETKLKNLSRSRMVKFMQKYRQGIIDVELIKKFEP